MTTTTPKTIVIIGRRWFDRRSATTEHSAEITIDGKRVEGVGGAHGSGDQYAYNAIKKLEALRLIPPRESNSESPWRYAERLGITLRYSAADVGRRKDL